MKVSMLPLIAVLAGCAAPLPKFSFSHAGLIERFCAGEKPDPSVLAEIDARLPEFEAAWAKDGPVLLAETFKLTGQPYRYAETMATLHGCPDMPSMSFPLLVSAVKETRAWAAAHPSAAGADMNLFVYTVWHESSHRYVDDVLRRLPGGTTPLLRKYAQESPMTQAHLHLFAIDKLIHSRLGRENEYQERVARQTALKTAPIVRALQIVDTEGAEKLVAELRQ